MSYAIEAKETLKAASNAVYFLSDDANRDVADYYLVDLVADEQTLELTPLDSIAALSRYFEEEGADRDGERDLVLTKGSSKEKLAKLSSSGGGFAPGAHLGERFYSSLSRLSSSC